MFVWRGRIEAAPLYLLMSGVMSLLFATVFTMSAVYRIQAAGLNPLQLVLVGTALELGVLLFEIPTGIVADVYSRRLSMVIGFALIGVGFLVEGTLPLFATILLAQLLWGVGWTFTSGAREAWLADEIGEERAGPVYLRAAQAGQVGSLLGALVGAGLATVQLNLPILAGGALFLVLAAALALVMPERGFRPVPRAERGSWRAMGDTLLAGTRLARDRPLLRLIFGIAVFYGMSSEGFDRLSTAHLLDAFTLPALGPFEPVAWFGLMSIVSQLLGLVATELVRRRLDLRSQRATAVALFAVDGSLAAGVLAFALAGDFALALTASWCVSALRKVSDPLATAWLNRGLDPGVRATVLSMRGQADAFGQVAGGPVLGLIGSAVSLRAALLTASAVLLPALPLYARAIRRDDDVATRPDRAAAPQES